MNTGGWEKGLSSATMSLRTHGRKAKKLFEQTRTAAEKYELKVAELGAMHKRSMLDTDTYNRAMVRLRDQYVGLVPGLAKTTPLTKRLGNAVGGLRAKFNAATASIGGFRGMIAGLGVAMVATKIKRQIDDLDKLGHTASKLGVTTEALGKLRYAGQLSGVESSTVDMALQRMTRRVAEARMGTGEARGALAELGLNPQRLASMAPDKMFLRVADAMGKVRDQSDKVRLSMKLFDSEGVALVNMLNMGRKGLLDAGEEAKRFGVAITDAGVKRAQEAANAMTRMGNVATGVFNEAALAISPYIELIGRDLVNAYNKAGRAADDAAKKGSKIAVIADVLHTVATGFKGFRAGSYKIAAGTFEGAAAVQRGAINLTTRPELRDNTPGRLATLASSLRATADEQGAIARAAWLGKTPSERVAAMLQSGKGIGNVSRGTGTATALAEIAGQAEKTEDVIAKLNTEISRFGKSRFWGELEKLRKGDDPFRVEEAEKLVATLDKLENKAVMADRGKAITAAVMTPLETFRAGLADARGLLDASVISKTTYDRHVKGLRDTALSGMMRDVSQSPAMRFSPVEVYGSQEAASVIAKSLAPAAGTDKAAQQRETLARKLDRMIDGLRDVERAIQRQPQPQPMNVPTGTR